jgi:GNAT superfamily N-acetyltransferase
MASLFKVAQPSDLETLVPLVRDYYEYDRHYFDESIVRAALTWFLNDETLGRAWLIEVNGVVVGYMILTLGYSLNYLGRDTFVDELFIQESWRGRGLGRAALAFLEAWGREHGVKALHLEVEQANTTARAVYQALGFEDHDQYLMTCWLGE